MRFRSLLPVAAIAAVVAACSDDSRTPLPTQPPSASAIVTAAIACDAEGQARVRTIIRQLYANNAKTRDGLLKKFNDGLALVARGKTVEGFRKFTDIMKKVFADYQDDKLANVAPSITAVVVELVGYLFVCGGEEPPPEVPLEGDVILGVIDDPTKEHTFVSSSGDYAVQTPPGMFSQPVVILGSKQSDGFLVQSIYQEFPIKTEITVNPPGTETGLKAIIKVCQYEEEFPDDGPNRSFMRIAQRHNDGETQIVDVLQFTTGGPFLTCPETAPPPPPVGSAGFLSRSLAAASRALRGSGAVAVSTFAPSELHAASMVDGGVGGLADDFFSFYAGVEVPDLIIQSITLTPPSPTDVSGVTFSIVVQNIGRGRSPATTLEFRATATSTAENIPVPPLLPSGEGGGTTTVTSAGYLLAAGNYVATATADFPDDVEELNETAAVPFANNTLTRNYTVTPGGPDIGVDDTNVRNRQTLAASRTRVQTVALRRAR